MTNTNEPHQRTGRPRRQISLADREKFLPSYSRDLGHDLVRDFFEPCLAAAGQYDRATGDFCSSFLSAGALGFSEFFINGGSMRLITNGRFTESDYKALEDGASHEQIIIRAIDRDMDRLDELVQNDFRRRHVEVFAWLLKHGRIRLKVALVKQDGRPVNVEQSHGVFHSKVGICYWENGSIISFIGGLNESQRALLHNSESFDPAYSWMGHEDRIHKHIEQFETLWFNNSPHTEVIDFPEAAAQNLVAKYAPASAPDPITQAELTAYQAAYGDEPCDEPLAYELREYQEERVAEWEAQGHNGVLSMATGTGKTLTAIAAAQRWIAETPEEPHLVVISAPQQHIVQQWSREVEKFIGIRPVSSVDTKGWQEDLGNWLLRASIRTAKRDMWLLTTNDGLSTHSADGLRSLALGKDLQIMIIGDEAHSLGTRATMDMLDNIRDAFSATLGLTATPHRHFDDDGTSRLFNFFGPELHAYTLADAIADDWLCPYEYHFEVHELTQNEFDEYKRLTSKMKPYLFDAKDGLDYATLERARVLSDAQCKLDYLDRFLADGRQSHVLFYCSPNHLQAVSDRTARAGYRRAQITYRTKTKDRMPILEGFSDGTYDALVAIQCLDEGVDVPAARVAVFMASTTNPKQYIQRRGRILRRAPGKERAIIYDVLVGPSTQVRLPGNVIFRREFDRAQEFAQDATNADDALRQLSSLDVYEEIP
ncbi:DEAD/DEAH box helicase family protein [Spectribacter hydrogenooxidans]|uniref:DEAD/DEAH box helicase family protein n=1 Tax=Spectribacter hydrogenoxidans TaxID=3075608 RepID=A0ABU3C006_9GAMM|nr:DEAD/DEAH box helicase family protein [Salinisphaera sp. W335]MDT0634887.1 DEAD/DEAH box helicase family protein [Salinisphaera sp. W335]